jgi:hypothetical protein
MCAFVCAGILAVGPTVSAGVPAADSYELTWLGLDGAQFVHLDGTVYAESKEIADNGWVLGRNRIFYGGTTNLGDAWWVSDGTTTHRVGLFDADHTKTGTGEQKTYVLGFDGGGQFVFGDSYKYRADGSKICSTPWVWDGAVNIALGLTGPEYTHADGYTASNRWEGGANGNFAGMNTIYNGGTTSLGTAGWVYDYSAGTTTRVGLTGAEYVRADGYVQTKIGRVSQGGDYVFGRTYRYSGSTAMGTHGWRYDVATGTTVQIGLTAAENVRADGYMEVEIRRGNASGQLNGLSRRYSGSTDMGRVAWLFDGTSTVSSSPTGSEFVRSDGYRYEDAWHLNASGQVAGEATTYDGASTAGKRAWFYDGATTHVLDGLQGGYFDKPNGHNQALPNGLNDAGQVTGTSYRYNISGTGIGLQGWFYDSGTDTTVALGLTDPAYTRVSDDKQYHFPSALSESGMVLGKSDRYDGLFNYGYWVYDWQTDDTYELAFSTRSDGYYNTAKRQFTTAGDGVVGYYEIFDEFDVSQGFSLYYWTIDRVTDTPVWYDLEDRTSLAAMEDLYALYTKGCDMNSDAWFAGTGTMADGSQGAYLLTPADSGVPGDFDGDGDVDADDIDLLADAIESGSSDSQFDVNGDSFINGQDLIDHVATLVERTDGGVGTYRGDFNLDGYVDGTDLAILKAGFGLTGLGYAAGNANADDYIDGTDLSIFKATFGFSGTPGGGNPPAIPEPATLSLLALGGLALLRRKRGCAG